MSVRDLLLGLLPVPIPERVIPAASTGIGDSCEQDKDDMKVSGQISYDPVKSD